MRIWSALRMRLRCMLYRFGIGYVTFDGTEAGLWREAARHVPFSYRWLGRSISVAEVDSKHPGLAAWDDLKSSILPGDRICPFEINPRTLAMRRGLVVIREGQAIGGIVTESS